MSDWTNELWNRETWRFINSFAPWLSAIGTLLAVITSLYLARRGNRISLKLILGIRKVAALGGGTDHGQELIWLNIVNLGRRAATITSLHWRPLPWKRWGLIWLAPSNIYSSRFPVTLNDGQEANYALEIERFRENFRDFARKQYSGHFGGLKLHFLRVCVSTSTGAVYKKKPEKPLRELLRALAMGKLAKKR